MSTTVVMDRMAVASPRFRARVAGVFEALAMYVYPPLAFHLFPFIAGASALAEIPLQLWLLVMGVNSQRWNEQARAVEESCSYS
jgi:hypothetical protein